MKKSLNREKFFSKTRSLEECILFLMYGDACLDLTEKKRLAVLEGLNKQLEVLKEGGYTFHIHIVPTDIKWE